MALLTNEYFDAERLSEFILAKLNQSKWYPQSIYKKISALYYGLNSREEVYTLLQQDKRFDDYPYLRSLLLYLSSIDETTPRENIQARLTALQAQYQSDAWDTARADEFFDDYNQKHRYFVADEPTRALFHMLAKACRARIIFVEKNNTPEDTMAYEYAYKMMALYLDDITRDTPENWFKKIAKSFDDMTKSLVNNKKCYHDLLLVQLNLPNASEIGDRTGWIHLIQREGAKVIPAFNMSVEIEALNHRKAPSDINEATRLLSGCSYTRGSEDAPFASLCLRYQVNEAQFNKCLNYMHDGWPKKTSDHLPDIQVQSDRFVMSKLPVDDKRALIMGEITDCCQSIGKNSEQCVRDLTSLSDNGLYVIQRGNKIIGQAYAWLSDTGNLCLDSIECLPHEIDDDSLRALLQSFAVTVLNQDASIKRVTLGTGGKTPENLYPEETVVAESMRQGYFYGDADKQYCIAKRRPPLTQEQQQAWNKILSRCTHLFRDCIEYLSEHLEKHDDVVSKLSFLVTTYPQLQEEMSASRVKRLIMYTQHPSLDDLIPIDVETLRALPPEQQQAISTTRLVWYRDTPETLSEVLPFIAEHDRLGLIKNKDSKGDTLLHQVPNLPEIFATILSYFPENERLQACLEKNSAGSRAIDFILYKPDLIKKVLSLLPRPDAFKLCHEKFSSSNGLLDYAASDHSLVEMILALYPEDARFEACQQKNFEGNTILHLAAGHFDSLSTVLSFLPEDKRLIVCHEIGQYGDTVLHCAAKNPASFEKILSLYPESDRFKACQKENVSRKSVFYHASCTPPSFEKLLSLLPENERIHACIQINPDYPYWPPELLLFNTINHPTSLQKILLLLPEADRLKACQQKEGHENRGTADTLLHKSSKNHQSLMHVLSVYPDGSERLKACKEINKHGETVLLCAADEYIRQCQDSETLPLTIETILSLYPKNERLQACQEKDSVGRTVLTIVSNNPNALKTILSLLPEEDHLKLCQYPDKNGKTLLHRASDNPNALAILLSLYPKEERFKVCQTQTIGWGAQVQTVFDTAFNSSCRRSFFTLLSLLPEHDRLKACQETSKYRGGRTFIDILSSENSLERLLSQNPHPAHVDYVEKNPENFIAYYFKLTDLITENNDPAALWLRGILTGHLEDEETSYQLYKNQCLNDPLKQIFMDPGIQALLQALHPKEAHVSKPLVSNNVKMIFEEQKKQDLSSDEPNNEMRP